MHSPLHRENSHIKMALLKGEIHIGQWIAERSSCGAKLFKRMNKMGGIGGTDRCKNDTPTRQSPFFSNAQKSRFSMHKKVLVKYFRKGAPCCSAGSICTTKMAHNSKLLKSFLSLSLSLSPRYTNTQHAPIPLPHTMAGRLPKLLAWHACLNLMAITL